MPVQTTYPGVYIEEKPSDVRPIVGVATSITAFIGRARRGPLNDPVMVNNFGEFTRRFGGLWADSPMSYSVQQFFTNGGSQALIVRVHKLAGVDDLAKWTLPGPAGSLVLHAANPGDWPNNLRVRVDHQTEPPSTAALPLFNLFVEEPDPAGNFVPIETFRNVSHDPAHRRFVTRILEQQSDILRVNGVPHQPTPAALGTSTAGSAGQPITDAEISAAALEAPKQGLWALEKADLFNILVIPPLERGVDPGTAATLTPALALCKRRRAMLIVDPPEAWDAPSDVTTGVGSIDDPGFGLARDENAAIYFPRILAPDVLRDGVMMPFAPSGMVAGIWARTDSARGVWKAPAGQDASLLGVQGLTYQLTDAENGQLNPIGVNCLRSFRVYGNLVWGARTLRGADRLADQWKYIPIRRLALYLEETLFRSTTWVVFEPNDEPLWSQIRLNVGAFMHDLFRQGAFQGRTAKEAYLVKCDSETTQQSDIDKGIVNIVVGFAPLKPAEFVIITIQQLAGQIQT